MIKFKVPLFRIGTTDYMLGLLATHNFPVAAL